MNKKYKLVEKKFFPKINRELWQIEAVVDFFYIKKGERGGWIEKEDNLSHDGTAWVFDNAKVYGDAQVFDHAKVGGNAKVYGNAKVCGDAQVYGNAKVFDYAKVFGNANVDGKAWVYGNAWVYGYAQVYSYARVSNDKEILVLSTFGNFERIITCTPDKSRKMQIACGCFLGGIDDFEQAVHNKYGNDPNNDYILILPFLKKKEAEWTKGKQK